jgi:hypothetical protein
MNIERALSVCFKHHKKIKMKGESFLLQFLLQLSDVSQTNSNAMECELLQGMDSFVL